MKDRNVVIVSGLVYDVPKFGQAKNGNRYGTFSMKIENTFQDKDLADDTERDTSCVYIRVMVFDKRLIEYLHNTVMKKGNRVSVFGRLSSHRAELRGVEFMQLVLVARDIDVLKPNQKETNINS